VEILKNLTDAELEALEQKGLVDWAQNDTPDGFAAFYELVFGVEIPEHAYREWIIPLYESRKRKKGRVIKAFRGSTKTTTLTIGFTAFRIGHEPHKSNLLIQVGDDIAQDNSAAIARIIAENPGWKKVFPNIQPDYAKGWGAGGYEVKDLSVLPDVWAEKNAQRKDPTLVGLGYSSRAIIGKHPSGLLILDDIHDENNTSSEKELSGVLKILNGTILKTSVESTWMIAIGTPWVEGDVLDYLENTGEFDVVETPIFRDVESSDVEFMGTPIELTWKKVKPLEFVKREYALDLTPGKVEFYRMLLLNLSKIQQRVFTWQKYFAQDIDATWPMTVGCDYAGTMDEFKNRTGDNDYFCLAYVMKNPRGGAIVYDGVRARTTQAQAEAYLLGAQNMFRNHIMSVVEGDSKGEEFIQVVRRNPGIKVLALKTGGRGKAKRLERELQPLLASGMVKISDADTPFLNALRKELSDYPSGRHDDTLDAVYWALRGMPDVLTGEKIFSEELPTMGDRKKTESPWASLARA